MLHLAHHPRGDLGSGVGIHDPQLDAGQRLPGGTQQVPARALGVVVLVGEQDDGSGGLGHPVDLRESAPEDLQAPDEDVLGDG